MLRPRFVVIAIALSAFVASPALAGDTHRDRDREFRVQIPDGWDTTTATAVATLNDAVMKITKQSIHYSVCFVPRGRTSSDLPRILIQWQSWPEPPPSYEAIDEVLARELPGALKKSESLLPVKLQTLEAGGHFIDQAKNRIVLRLRASVPGDGMIDAVSFGMLGRRGTALLHCYARYDKFEAMLPVFERFANSFRFDPGLAYKPNLNATPGKEWAFGPGSNSNSAAASGGGVNWDGFMNGGMRGAMIGGAIGGVIAAANWLRKKAIA